VSTTVALRLLAPASTEPNAAVNSPVWQRVVAGALPSVEVGRDAVLLGPVSEVVVSELDGAALVGAVTLVELGAGSPIVVPSPLPPQAASSSAAAIPGTR
jgi:hypothetical protein